MRQYIAQSLPDRKGLLVITGKDYRYMKQVLRLAVGDMVDVRLPAASSNSNRRAGSLQQMTVCRIDEKARQLVLQVCAETPAGLTSAMAASSSSKSASGSSFSGQGSGAGGSLSETGTAAKCRTAAGGSADDSYSAGSADGTQTGGGSACSARGGAASASENRLPELWLFQFVARSAKMDTIVRQATECGVKVIVPVAGDFSQAGAKERNFRGDRYQRIIKEARQQSGSAVDTEVSNACSLEEAIARWQERCRSFYAEYAAGASCSGKQWPGTFAGLLYERTEQTQSLHSALARAMQGKPAVAASEKPAPANDSGRQAAADRGVQLAALVCGAEGGISPRELEKLVQAGFVPLHFKTNILRCETAALYGIAALQSALAEGNIWQCKE